MDKEKQTKIMNSKSQWFFCAKLKNLRLYKSLTQAQLGKLCDLTEAEISFYETGSRKPGLDNIIKLCKGLNVSATELLGV